MANKSFAAKFFSWLGLFLLLVSGLWGIFYSFRYTGSLLMIGLGQFALALPGLFLVHVCLFADLYLLKAGLFRLASASAAFLAFLAVLLTLLFATLSQRVMLDNSFQRGFAAQAPVSALYSLSTVARQAKSFEERHQAAEAAYELYRCRISYLDENHVLTVFDADNQGQAIRDLMPNMGAIMFRRVFIIPIVLVNLWGLIIWCYHLCQVDAIRLTSLQLR